MPQPRYIALMKFSGVGVREKECVGSIGDTELVPSAPFSIWCLNQAGSATPLSNWHSANVSFDIYRFDDIFRCGSA